MTSCRKPSFYILTNNWNIPFLWFCPFRLSSSGTNLCVVLNKYCLNNTFLWYCVGFIVFEGITVFMTLWQLLIVSSCVSVCWDGSSVLTTRHIPGSAKSNWSYGREGYARWSTVFSVVGPPCSTGLVWCSRPDRPLTSNAGA